MKESITKFDLEAAFKALDDIDIPKAGKVKANRPALTEIFSRKTKFDSLMEEYYDISSTEGLNDAHEAREAEVAKAKLARIEKIVDLDADSPEDLLTSYVGKYIMQCPQCMTLFYKDQEDIVESEDDPDTVNVNEVCQHCGNETGYTLVGKVGEATPEDNFNLGMTAEEPPVEEIPEENAEEPTEENNEESNEEPSLDDLEGLDLNLEPDEEEEKTEESFAVHNGESLVEDLSDDKDLDEKLKAHNEYIEYLRDAIAQEEAKLEKETNEQVKVAIQRNIDAFKADLESALPDAVKNDEAIQEESVEETNGVELQEVETADEEVTEEPVTESLTEALHEDNDLEVSASEFKELIDSPEFKKPISEVDVQAILDSEREEEDDSAINESVEVNGEVLKYVVINTDGTIAGVPCTSEEEARELANQQEGRIVVELGDIAVTDLTEAGLKDLGKAIGKKIGQKFKNVKDKISAAIDKFVDNAKTRDEKADWVLANAIVENAKEVYVDTDGKLLPEENKNRRFNNFLVIGYKDRYSNNKPITMAPSFNNKDLVIGMEAPQVKAKYAEADTLAKGWSGRQGCGPAFIYLAKNAEGDDAVFLCEYFNGELANDQLQKYFDVVKKDLEAKARIKEAGGVQSEITAEDSVKTEEVQADKIKAGMKVKFGDEIAEVIEVTNSKFGAGKLAIKVKAPDGSTEALIVDSIAKILTIVTDGATAATESLETKADILSTIMEDLEEIKESVLEAFISNSLVESYGNVAGFRLKECAYDNGKFTASGVIYFTSGKTRNTTYSFTECINDNGGKISLHGLNEKLGLDKQFVLTGSISDKTFITESFKCNKN